MNNQIKQIISHEWYILINDIRTNSDQYSTKMETSKNDSQVKYNQMAYCDKLTTGLLYEQKLDQLKSNSYIWVDKILVQKVKNEYNFVSNAYQQLHSQYMKTFDPFTDNCILTRDRKWFKTSRTKSSFSDADLNEATNPDLSNTPDHHRKSEVSSGSQSKANSTDDMNSSDISSSSLSSSGTKTTHNNTNITDQYDYSRGLYVEQCH